jgi:hypothetical protein
MALVLCLTKIGVVRNHQNSTDFQNHFGAAPLFLPDGRVSSWSPLGMHPRVRPRP